MEISHRSLLTESDTEECGTGAETAGVVQGWTMRGWDTGLVGARATGSTRGAGAGSEEPRESSASAVVEVEGDSGPAALLSSSPL